MSRHSVLVAVLDSNVVSSLTRTSRRVPRSSTKRGTDLDVYVRTRALRIAIDSTGALEDEWARTAGREFVKELIVFWWDCKGVKVVDKPGSIPPACCTKLRRMGFPAGVDRLILKIALAVNSSRTIVSRDRDFWNPRAADPRHCVGRKNACVAKYLRETLRVGVCTLYQLLEELRRGSATN